MAIASSLRAYRPYLIFVAITLAVLLPLFTPGYILTLDMVFTPHVRVPSMTTSSFLFYELLHLLNVVIPSDILEKMILFIILFLSCVSMYALVKRAANGESDLTHIDIGAYAAGTLYAINPFTYARFMAGQFAVLLGYSLLPCFVMSLLDFITTPTFRRGSMLAFWAAVIGIVSIHSLGMVGLLSVMGLVSFTWTHRRLPRQLSAFMLYCLVSVGIFFVASSYWLIPLLRGTNTAARAIAGFTAQDEQAFGTIGNGLLGKLLHILRLQGFWAEGSHTFVLPQDHFIGWGVVIIALWILVGIGITYAWRRQRQLTLLLLPSAAIASIVATGIVNNEISRIMPLFYGFREPHKFVGLVALMYAFFAGCGTAAILDRVRSMQQAVIFNGALTAILLLPIALTPTMFWGFGGQLHPRTYPVAWANMNRRLDEDNNMTYKVLFLPWHLYMYFSFADRIIMNPAPSYFDKPTITNNNPEFGGAAPDKPDPQITQLGAHILAHPETETTLGAQLAPFHIKYVLLDLDNDFVLYRYLDKQNDLRLIAQEGNLKLYRNEAYRG